MRAANELTLEHGLDGWTMEDLAAATEVSRRTLFNYFPGKVDAVIGPMPEFPQDALDLFRRQGPTGVLIEDCRVLARSILDEEQFDSRDLALHRQVLVTNPRLVLLAHERFEQVAGELVGHILAREGAEFGVRRAALLVRLMVALFDSCMTTLADHDVPLDRPVADVYDESVQLARELLA